jgi:hypothetical protein
MVEKDKDVFVHPDICALNIKDGKEMNLLQEEGMVEFSELFKDVYNYDIGKFDKMSADSEKDYRTSLKKFYNTYTGDTGELPEHIKKFSHIKLRQFSKKECKTDGSFIKKYKGTLSEELFEKYALHLKGMYMKINKNQSDVVNILKEVFSIIDTDKGEKVIVNPKLDYAGLDELIKKTQELITNSYVSCEEDFLKGLNIFHEIILFHENKINDKKRDNIQKEFETTLTGENHSEKDIEKQGNTDSSAEMNKNSEDKLENLEENLNTERNGNLEDKEEQEGEEQEGEEQEGEEDKLEEDNVKGDSPEDKLEIKSDAKENITMDIKY